MQIKNVLLTIKQGDLTELSVDAIVNAANTNLEMGGGVAGAINRKGGQTIETEAMKKGPIAVGDAIVTSAGQLKAKYVIHAATMAMDFKTDEHKIRRACASAIICADQLKLTTLAFPALGCGVGQFSIVGAAKIMAQEVLKFVRHNHEKTTLREIIFCLKDDATFQTFKKSAEGYVDYMLNRYLGPYVTVDTIIELPEGIILIERSNPPYGWALPGGFVDYGESLEDAARREAKEETNMEMDNMRQFHVYSDPHRDPRFHTVSTVFVGKGRGTPQFGDDAKGLKVVAYEQLSQLEYAFDHKKVILDYLQQRKS